MEYKSIPLPREKDIPENIPITKFPISHYIPIGESSLLMRKKWSLPLALNMLFDSVVSRVRAYQNQDLDL